MSIKKKPSDAEVVEAPKVTTAEDVKNFLKMFLGIYGVFQVDDDGQIQFSSGEPIILTQGKMNTDAVKKPLVIYDENIKSRDVLILNPFVESTALTPDREWFYTTVINDQLSRATVNMMLSLHKLALDTEKSNDESMESIELVSAIRPYVVDKKQLTEFEKIVAEVKGYNYFLNIFYVKKSMSAKLHCMLFDDGIEKQFPTIRKKSWENWRKMIERIFGELESNYSIIAKTIGCPQFDATTKCLYEILLHVGPYYQLVGYNLNLDEMKAHIDEIPVYYHRTQWLQQSAMSEKAVREAKTVKAGAVSTTDNTVTTEEKLDKLTSMVEQMAQPRTIPVGQPQPGGYSVSRPIQVGVNGVGVGYGPQQPMYPWMEQNGPVGRGIPVFAGAGQGQPVTTGIAVTRPLNEGGISVVGNRGPFTTYQSQTGNDNMPYVNTIPMPKK